MKRSYPLPLPHTVIKSCSPPLKRLILVGRPLITFIVLRLLFAGLPVWTNERAYRYDTWTGKLDSGLHAASSQRFVAGDRYIEYIKLKACGRGRNIAICPVACELIS